MTTLSFDPAKRGAAWARFDAANVLVGCGLEQGETFLEALDRLPLAGDELALVVIEVPQVYQQRQWKGDPNDLVAVAVTAGALAYRYRLAKRVLLPKPHDWKGSVPKEVTKERVLAELSAAERVHYNSARIAASLRHNAIDAIGLGLWATGRKR